MSKVLSILEALIANGISAEDIKDAANQLKAGKAKKGKKPSVADLLEDLSDDELRQLVVELELMKEKAAKKAKRKDLEKALAKADPEELEDAIAELAEDEDEDDEIPLLKLQIKELQAISEKFNSFLDNQTINNNSLKNLTEFFNNNEDKNLKNYYNEYNYVLKL